MKKIIASLILANLVNSFGMAAFGDSKDEDRLGGKIKIRQYITEQLGIENSAIGWDSLNKQVTLYGKKLKIDDLLLSEGFSYCDKNSLAQSLRSEFGINSADEILYGFVKIKSQQINDIDSQCELYKHIKTGALLLHVKNTDNEKSFGIAFKTPAQDNTGVNHIIEHSVLNGSQKYPVKSPFTIMEKQSLKTFLNAMTFNQFTLYPVASKNEKDLENLMNVYMDAVFNPNIYRNNFSFMQEGWRYVRDDNTGKLSLNGTVLNEMKGYYSDPKCIIAAKTLEALYPDTDVRFDSGGKPEEIPELTYQKFLETHKRFYNPSNSLIFLYGNMNAKNFLKTINDRYLSVMEPSNIDISFKKQEPFKERVHKIVNYPATSKDGSGKSYLELSFVTADNSNVDDLFAVLFLQNLLNMEASPLKRALLESGIVKNVGFSVNYDGGQAVFSIDAEDIDQKDILKFEKLVDEKLAQIAGDGFEQNYLESVFNMFEMSLKMSKQETTKGPNLNIDAVRGWIYAKDPMKYFNEGELIKNTRERFTKEFTSQLIHKYFLNNPHSASVFLKPSVDEEDGIAKEIDKKISLLTMQSKKHVEEQINRFNRWQNTSDAKEDLDKVPALSISDIDKSSEVIQNETKVLNGIKFKHYKLPTNGLSYVTMYYDLKGIEEKELLKVMFLADILGSVDTAKYGFSELNTVIGKTTGGISFGAGAIPKYKDSFNFEPKLVVNFSCISGKIEDSIGLVNEIISNSKFTDKNRILQLAKILRGNNEETIKSEPGILANYAVLNNMAPRGRFLMNTSPRSYYRFLDDMVKNFDKDGETFCRSLEDMRIKMFSGGLIIGYSGDNNDFKKFTKSFIEENKKNKENYITISTAGIDSLEEQFKNSIKSNTAYAMPYKTVDIYMGGNFVNDGYIYSGKIKVLEKILNTQYLWTEIRDKLGAYGAGSVFKDSGNCFLYASSAQNLKDTIKAFHGTVDYLRSFAITQEELDKFIIGTVADLDKNLGVAGKGMDEIRKEVSGISNKDLEKELNEVLSTTPSDIRNYADMMDKIFRQNNYSVAGSGKIIEENKDLFDAVEDIF